MCLRSLLFICLCLAGCAQQSVIRTDTPRLDGSMPADFSGSWERDYSRGNEITGALQDAYYRLSRTLPDQQRYRSGPGPVPLPQREMAAVYALAQLAELITRFGVVTIVQNENEIRIDREDDFALLCAFYDGGARAATSVYGSEICGWDGEQLVSRIDFPDGLQITQRFTISADRKQLRVVTTVASDTARVPVTVSRFYSRFDRPAPDFNCVETLSMKRVCSTGDIEL